MSIRDGKIYFLFSREYIHAKRDGGLWSDFGGRKDGDETFKETAIRECIEESSNILGIDENIIGMVNNSLYQITLDGYRSHVSFINYDENMVSTFRQQFLSVKKETPEKINKKGLYEKDMLRWIEYNDLKKNMHLFRPWYKKFIHHLSTLMT